MRRFYLAGSLIAMMLICSIAPRSLEAGGGGKFAKGDTVRGIPSREKFGGEMAVPMEFPSFLQAGAGIALANEMIYDRPTCLHRQYVAAQQTDIVLLKARSSSFNTDSGFAPLAGLYFPRQQATHPSAWPYSLMPVPQDGKFHYQATYVREPHLPAELAFLCTDELGFPHPDVPPGTGQERRIRWDYRFGVTPKQDPHEVQFRTNRQTLEPRVQSDGDQNLKTIDPLNRVMSYVDDDTSALWKERSLFYLDQNNRDQEDYLRFQTLGTGRVYITFECGNGTYSNWDLTLKLVDDRGDVVAEARSGSTTISMQAEYLPAIPDPKDPRAGSNSYRLQIGGIPKAKTLYSNVYYLPYRVSLRFIPGWSQ